MNAAAVTTPSAFTLADIEATRRRLGEQILETPVHRWRGPRLTACVGAQTQVFLKLELFQYTGSFKVRGALNNVLQLSAEQLACGITAVSSGNHAVATSYAARVGGTTAKVIMMKGANPFRVSQCRNFGAEVVIADNVDDAFRLVAAIQETEGRTFVHPYEGPTTALGAATLGLEFCRQVADLDAIIIAIGGGGLCGGMSAAIKLTCPSTLVYGVEPMDADSMHRSFAAGKPVAIERRNTIADSLNAPHAAPYTFGLCRDNVDGLVKVSDAQIRQAMAMLFYEMKLGVEPAAAAATAALCGPLLEMLRDKRVGVLVCGANTDIETFAGHIRQAAQEIPGSSACSPNC